jgi:SAM-dependent methyltransferase
LGFYDWDHPETAARYEAFCDEHPRYLVANQALVAAAGITSPLRVLDVGAGTGRTSALLPAGVRLTCVEPAKAMRELGMQRLPEAEWVAQLPEEPAKFDRILCSAGIWQMLPLDETLKALDRLLRPGGRLVFNIPACYLGEPDPPGGGSDPYLIGLPQRFPQPPAAAAASRMEPARSVPGADEIDAMLRAVGLDPLRWQHRAQLTQREYRDWLKIPVLTNHLFPDLPPANRAAWLDLAFEQCDPQSWRWETWSGWTCQKEPGFILVRNIIERDLIQAVRLQALEICGSQGWIDQNQTVVVDGFGPEDPQHFIAQGLMQCHPSFSRLRESPLLRMVLENVAGGPVKDQQGDVWRIVFPNRPDLTTPAHHDAMYFTEERKPIAIWTAWIPLTDCPLALGPLAVQDCRGEWRPQPMREGDVLLFTSYTPHRAIDNVSAGRLRLSVDLRFAAVNNTTQA